MDARRQDELVIGDWKKTFTNKYSGGVVYTNQINGNYTSINKPLGSRKWEVKVGTPSNEKGISKRLASGEYSTKKEAFKYATKYMIEHSTNKQQTL